MGKKSSSRGSAIKSSEGFSARSRANDGGSEILDRVINKARQAEIQEGAITLVKQPKINLHFDVDAVDIETKNKKWLKQGCLHCYLYPCVHNARLENYKGKVKEYLKDYRVHSYKVASRGSKYPRILFITDSPGLYDDEEGVCMVGESGKILSEAIDDAMIPMDDCRFTQVTRCRAMESKTPAIGDAVPCSAFLAQEIARYNPDVLVPMGALALKILLNDKDAKINAHVGVLDEIVLSMGTFKMFPLWSPGVISRDFGYYDDFVFYMCRLRQVVYASLESDEKFNIKISKDEESFEIADRLVNKILNKSKTLVYDIETVSLDSEKADGLSPYMKCTQIVSIAFEYAPNRSVVLFTYHPSVTADVLKRNKRLAKKLLLSNIPKIAHNAKFDDVFIKSKWGIEPVNFIEDTILSHYALVTERTGTHGLKVLAIRYAQLGDYSKEMRDEDAFDSENLFNIDIDTVGRYNAIDTIATGRVSRGFKNLEQVGESPAQAVAQYLLPKASRALADLEFSGLFIDKSIAKTVTKVFARNLQVVLDKIKADPMVQKFIESMEDLRADGVIGKSVKEFKIGSGPQVGVILFHEDFYGYTAEEFTPTGRAKTDGDVLNALALDHDCALLKLLLEYRRYKTTLSTFLRPFVKNSKRYKGFLHGQFNLFVTATGRLCVAKGTKVEIVGDASKGTESVPIEEIKVGDLAYTYGDGLNLTIKPVVWVGKTGHKKVIRVHWKSRGNSKHTGYVDLTPEHEVRKSDGMYCRAIELNVGDSVLSLMREINGWGYSCLYATGVKRVREHRFVYETLNGGISEAVHHKDGNKLNNSVLNLESLSRSEHSRIHATNPSMEIRKKISDATKKMLAEGRGAKPKYGVDNANYKHLDKGWIIAELIKFKGKPTRVCSEYNFDYDSFMKKVALHGIDWKEIRDLFTKDGRRITNGLILKARNVFLEEGQLAAQKFINSNYYRFRDLQEKFGHVPYNHTITKIEKLDASVDVYDLEVEDTHNFIANGVCVHNSSASPNLQNIPNKSSGHVKRLFVSRYPKGLLVSVDYSQIELRVLASLSGDETMLSAYREGKDLHKLTTLLIYDMSEDEYDSFPEGKRKLMRTVAKRINFGVVYGIQSEGVVRILKKENIIISEAEAAEYIKKFFDSYSGVEAWVRKTEDYMLDSGISKSAFGRVRRFPEVLYQRSVLKSSKYWTQGAQDYFAYSNSTQKAKRQAVNHVIQSTASDLTLCSLIVVNKWIKATYPNDASIFNIIHDALDFDVKREVALPVIKKVIDVMSNLPKYTEEIFEDSEAINWDFFHRIPITVSVDVGVNWRDSIEIDDTDNLDLKMLDEYLKKSKELEIENDKQLIIQV